MGESLSATLDCLDERGNGLRIEFEKQGDRFEHTIIKVCDGQTQPLLQSVEGTPEDFSPPSPPFAELHRQGDLIFLSGATTIGHWSMSVCVCEAALQMEVACRLKVETEWLGSQYRVISEEFDLCESQFTQLVTEDGSLVLCPSAHNASKYPATVQWRYCISPKA